MNKQRLCLRWREREEGSKQVHECQELKDNPCWILCDRHRNIRQRVQNSVAAVAVVVAVADADDDDDVHVLQFASGWMIQVYSQKPNSVPQYWFHLHCNSSYCCCLNFLQCRNSPRHRKHCFSHKTRNSAAEQDRRNPCLSPIHDSVPKAWSCAGVGCRGSC